MPKHLALYYNAATMSEHNAPTLPPKKAPDVHPVWEVIRFAIIALPLVFLFRSFIAQPFVVRGGSMEPTFQNNEYLIVYELPYHFRDPERGDVVVFQYPNDPKQHFVKRVVALPGETIEIRNNQITIYNKENIDGLVIDEPHIESPTHGNLRTTLKEDEFFVLGDNRNNSSDSRFWGPLEKEFITGRALLRLWPVNSLSVNPGDLDETYDID